MSIQMEFSHVASRGMVVTPHHLASQSGLAILRQGGTAMEATVAAAATLAVVYPDMNSIGGDAIWLIVPPDGEPFVIEAVGAAGSLATMEFYKELKEIPNTGPKSAITVAGTVSGWEEALNYVFECGYQRISTHKLLADAIHYAKYGFPVSSCHAANLQEFANTYEASKEFKKIFLPAGRVPKVGEMFYQKELANTFQNLADNGLSSFYKGQVAKSIEEDMKALGMPITNEDLLNHCVIRKNPLKLSLEFAELFNSPPPTQGVVSLSILGILNKLKVQGQHEGLFIHATVEATKEAFKIRDNHLTDPRFMKKDGESFLRASEISKMAKNIDFNKASAGSKSKGPGDTVWVGVMDDKGFSVSFIQSVYHNFGSGVILPKTGILWHNRGISYSLDKDHLLHLKPGKKPLHTLNPAAAKLNDGRIMIYGTRGGDGQPQTQAAVFHRYVVQGINLQKSIAAPRWLYGDTIDKKVVDLIKLEDRFCEDTVNYLKDRGHVIEVLPPFTQKVGQVGALVRHPDGRLEGAFDPRCNGSAVGF